LHRRPDFLELEELVVDSLHDDRFRVRGHFTPSEEKVEAISQLIRIIREIKLLGIVDPSDKMSDRRCLFEPIVGGQK
jgi:hypothetical protein